MGSYDPFNLLRTKKESIGKAPGTLAYSGSYGDVALQIDVLIYSQKFYKRKSFQEVDALKGLLAEAEAKEDVCWINIVGLHDQTLIRSIGDVLGIHHMDLEDVVHVSQWSKILNQGDYLFSIFKMIYLNNDEIMHEHVSIILKRNIVITFQETPGDVFDHIRNRLNNSNGQLRSRSSNYLFYSLLDAIVDEYIVVINQISLNFNEIEMKIFEGHHPNKENFYTMRKELLYFSNSISPLLESLRKFIADESLYHTSDMIPYYSDLHDHLNQVYDSIKAYREMSNSLHEMHISNVSMRMNRTMMTLTIFSAIFIPLNFIAGVFGMNFISVPGLRNPQSFQYFVLFCVILAGSMVSYFKIKKWF